MICVDCGAALRVRRNQAVPYELAGLRSVILKGIEIRECHNGHREIAIPRLEELHRVVASVLIRKPSRLAPEELRFLRRYLGYSQVDFAKRAGVAPESVSRWESGALKIAAATERLVRLMAASLPPVQDYRLLDVFASMKSSKAEPAKMHLRRSERGWEAA